LAPVNGADRLLIVNADGSGKPTVAPEPTGVEFPVWSPDGSQIAFNDSDSASGYLSVVNADGTQYRQLYDNGNSYTPFTWSGKGGELAYVGTDPRRDTYMPAIFAVRADGGGRRMLVDGAFPSWSPDGRMLAFLRCPFIRVINSDGTGERRLVRFDGSADCEDYPDEYLDILWSADSQKIAYTTSFWKNPKRSCESSGDCNYIDPETNTELCRVHIIGVSEGSHVQVVGGGLLGKFDSQCDIAWSPDGKEVAFTRNGFLYSVTAEGKRERPFAARGLQPSWSPDGSRLAFLRNGTIYALDVQRHEERRVARADELSWSPDGKALVIARTIKPPVQTDQGEHEPGEYVFETIPADSGHVRRIWPKVGTCDCSETPVWQPR
jgi:Tol biopolymer transport system component